ncbi:hypothetical protein AB8O55_11805 [Saccharopolyspora cebuensis]|uniref:Endonuclease/exonuclease/phosphatase domain-containing protein n=1 Tax=Saccharopolyspora cebuensis TaxID=418759 RepID=A0ABV4CG74_9PSEU
MPPKLTVGTFNIKSFTYRPGRGHDFGPALHHISRCTPSPPDVFSLPEATHADLDGHQPMWAFTNALSDMLPDGESYLPFWAPVEGRGNPPLLLLNASKIRVRRWFPPHCRSGLFRWGFVEAELPGVAGTTWISAVHWQGGQGRGVFEQHAAALAPYAAASTLLAGDFNATSSWAGEVQVDWPQQSIAHGEQYKLLQKCRWSELAQDWVLDTRQIDLLRTTFGFWDAGERAGDPTVTTHEQGSSLRIDRIMASTTFPYSTLLDYRVFREEEDGDSAPLSDHRYVYAELGLAS